MSNKYEENRKWYLWEDTAHSPMLNMAIDENLLPEISALQIPLLRIYAWDRPAVSIGYVQKYSAAPQKKYTIVRRPTGGGVVFHDIDLTYTVIIPVGHWIEKQNRLESYHIFHRIVIKALASLNIVSHLVESASEPVDRSIMCCFTSPTRYDVVSNDTAGEQIKVAGAAQRRTKYGILHQGSIVVENIFSKRKKLSESLLSAFVQELSISFTNFKPSANFFSSAAKLAEKKYAAESWNRYRKI
jgi:lipoate-protein ligase A